MPFFVPTPFSHLIQHADDTMWYAYSNAHHTGICTSYTDILTTKNDKAVVTTEHDYEIGVAEPTVANAKTSWSAYTPAWLWSVPAYVKCRQATVLAVLPGNFGDKLFQDMNSNRFQLPMMLKGCKGEYPG